MVLKTVWRFIDIVIGYFVIYLSSLLIKIFTDTYYIRSHKGRSILKNGIPSHGLFGWCHGSI